MKTQILSILLITIGTFFLSCTSDDDQDLKLNKSILFGEVYGQCAGDCRALYLLTEEGLFEDSGNDTTYGDWQNTTFKDSALSLEKFELSKSLLEIPDGILDYDKEIGDQTLADFDYFIQIKINDKIKSWLFDEVNDTINANFKLYFDNLIQKNKQLKDQQ